MKSTKHIVWLTPGFSADLDDDVCMPYLLYLLTAIERNYPDYVISIIAFDYPFNKEPYQWSRTMIYPAKGRNRSGIMRLFTWWRVWNLFNKINRKQPVSIIHSFWFSQCMLVGNLLSSRFKIPHINNLMGQDVLPANKYLKKYFLRTTPVIALSERHGAVFFKSTNCKPYRIIPFGIDEEAIETNGIIKYDIICVGSLVKVKRYDRLLRIISKVKNKFPHVKVLIAGDGDERGSLVSMTVNLNIQDNIIFAGNQKQSQVLKLMQQSKLFVHTSDFEGLCFVFLEAMKSGLPIITTPVGMATAREHWYITSDESEMANYISELLQNGKKYESTIPYSSNNAAKNYIELYSTFTNKKNDKGKDKIS